jgi:hypothetical protein
VYCIFTGWAAKNSRLWWVNSNLEASRFQTWTLRCKNAVGISGHNLLHIAPHLRLSNQQPPHLNLPQPLLCQLPSAAAGAGFRVRLLPLAAPPSPLAVRLSFTLVVTGVRLLQQLLVVYTKIGDG